MCQLTHRLLALMASHPHSPHSHCRSQILIKKTILWNEIEKWVVVVAVARFVCIYIYIKYIIDTCV